MLFKLALPEIRELVATNDHETLRDVLNRWLPADLAEILDALEDDQQLVVIRQLTPALAAETFGYLPRPVQIALLGRLAEDESAFILNEMPPDDRTSLFGELSVQQAELLINRLDPEQRLIARTLLGYAENSVGRLMTPDYVAVGTNWSFRRVLEHIREHGRDSETLNVIYVIDDKQKLLGDLRIREILLASEDLLVRDLLHYQYVSLSVADDKQHAVELFRKYDRVALPVVDTFGRLAGIVTLDDVIDIAEEAATEAIQRFGGLEALDAPYLSTPLPEMIRKRASWLVILFLGEMLTATAMGYFEDQLARAVVLALFVPLIISSGGNSGSQAATLIIRALALGEIALADWWLVMRRELLSGFLLGSLLGIIGFIRIAAWNAIFSTYGQHWKLIGLTVSVSLLGIVMWGTLTGSMLPFLLRRLGLDPATSSAPFVATLVDVTGLIIYFSVALLFLRGTLL